MKLRGVTMAPKIIGQIVGHTYDPDLATAPTENSASIWHPKHMQVLTTMIRTGNTFVYGVSRVAVGIVGFVAQSGYQSLAKCGSAHTRWNGGLNPWP